MKEKHEEKIGVSLLHIKLNFNTIIVGPPTAVRDLFHSFFSCVTYLGHRALPPATMASFSICALASSTLVAFVSWSSLSISSCSLAALALAS